MVKLFFKSDPKPGCIKEIQSYKELTNIGGLLLMIY